MLYNYSIVIMKVHCTILDTITSSVTTVTPSLSPVSRNVTASSVMDHLMMKTVTSTYHKEKNTAQTVNYASSSPIINAETTIDIVVQTITTSVKQTNSDSTNNITTQTHSDSTISITTQTHSDSTISITTQIHSDSITTSIANTATEVNQTNTDKSPGNIIPLKSSLYTLLLLLIAGTYFSVYAPIVI